jgi:hypothetical protein
LTNLLEPFPSHQKKEGEKGSNGKKGKKGKKALVVTDVFTGEINIVKSGTSEKQYMPPSGLGKSAVVRKILGSLPVPLVKEGNIAPFHLMMLLAQEMRNAVYCQSIYGEGLFA